MWDTLCCLFNANSRTLQVSPLDHPDSVRLLCNLSSGILHSKMAAGLYPAFLLDMVCRYSDGQGLAWNTHSSAHLHSSETPSHVLLITWQKDLYKPLALPNYCLDVIVSFGCWSLSSLVIYPVFLILLWLLDFDLAYPLGFLSTSIGLDPGID